MSVVFVMKSKRYLALLLLLLLSGCPPLHKEYYFVASDDQIEDLVLGESYDTYWMCHDDLCDLKFWFDVDLNNVGRKYWVEVVFKYSNDLNRPVSFLLDSMNLKSTLFDFEFYDYAHWARWESIAAPSRVLPRGITSKINIFRFRAYPKDRSKVIGDTLKLSSAGVYIDDSIQSGLPELMFLLNESKSNFLGKRSR